MWTFKNKNKNVRILKTISEQKCPKSQHFLNLMWFLASRRKKGKKKKKVDAYLP